MGLMRRAVRSTEPFRVMFVVPDLEFGGAERHVATTVPRLDPARFAPSVVCIGAEGALFPALAAAGVPAQALGRTKRQSLLALAELVREMRRTRPDLVVTRGYNAEMLGRIAALLARVPRMAIWLHDCGDVVPRTLTRKIFDRLLDPVTSAYYGVAHGQVAPLATNLGYRPGKIAIARNGIDASSPTSAPPAGRDPALARALGIGPDDGIIGVVAVLRPEKDHATLLRAARIVLERLPDTRVLLIGDGPLRAELERLAAELGIAERVVFAGMRSDVPELLGLVDVLVLSSVTECLPMALLEGMAAGRPVVATAVGGVPEIVVDGITGYVVPPRDPSAMADRIVALLGDRERARAMGVVGRRRVESEFSLERSVRAAERVMTDTLLRNRKRLPIRLSLVVDHISVGGAEVLLLNLFRAFDPDVVRPEIVCLREAGNLVDRFRAAGVPVHVLGRSGRYDLRTVPRLVRQLRASRTDVVLLVQFHRAALTLGRLAARLAGCGANIIAAHDMGLIGKRCLPRHVVETMFLSDALVLLAPLQREHLRREEGLGRYPWRRTREVFIPNGIPLPEPPTEADRKAARSELGLDPDDVVVGIVARLNPEKAHHVLLQAIARLAPHEPRLRLVVVGDGELEPQLRALTAELGIGDRVLFTGRRADVAELLPGFDVACLSSVHECAPLSVIEAMAAGLPVVVTDCGALRDLVTDGGEGFVVPVGDVGALADRIARLAADPGLRASLGAHSRAQAERRYRIEGTARQYEQLMLSLVGNDHGS